MGGFAAKKQLIVHATDGRNVGYEAPSTEQYKRAEDLSEIVRLETQEFDNQFNLKPQTPHDLYFDKLKKANIKNMQI